MGDVVRMAAFPDRQAAIRAKRAKQRQFARELAQTADGDYDNTVHALRLVETSILQVHEEDGEVPGAMLGALHSLHERCKTLGHEPILEQTCDMLLQQHMPGLVSWRRPARWHPVDAETGEILAAVEAASGREGESDVDRHCDCGRTGRVVRSPGARAAEPSPGTGATAAAE